MILFYNKSTGKIIGTIDGRVHGKDHLGMWIGDKAETDRIICEWKRTGKEEREEKVVDEYVSLGSLDDDGEAKYKRVRRVEVRVKKAYEPTHEQKEVFDYLDKNKASIRDYIVDVKEKKLKKG